MGTLLSPLWYATYCTSWLAELCCDCHEMITKFGIQTLLHTECGYSATTTVEFKIYPVHLSACKLYLSRDKINTNMEGGECHHAPHGRGGGGCHHTSLRSGGGGGVPSHLLAIPDDDCSLCAIGNSAAG